MEGARQYPGVFMSCNPQITWLKSPGPYEDPGDYQGRGGEVLQANQGKLVLKV